MSRKHTTGFTLVELLVVIGIIAVLIAILLPVLNKAREAAKTVACASNMHQIYLGLTQYSYEWDGWVPVGVWGDGINTFWIRADGTKAPGYVAWSTIISGGIDARGPAYMYTDYFGASAPKANNGIPSVFFCPAQSQEGYNNAWTSAGRGSYAMNFRLLGWVGYSPPLGPIDPPDRARTSVSPQGTWYCYRLSKSIHPSDLYLFGDAGWNDKGGQLYLIGFGSDPRAVRHSGDKGLNITYADGHVDFVQVRPSLWPSPTPTAGPTAGQLPWFNR